MYQRNYLRLSEAVRVVAERLAEAEPTLYADAKAAFEAACKELVQAVYDGAVQSDGLFWEQVSPDYDEPDPVLPPQRSAIDKRLWANLEKHEIRTDEHGKHSVLDVVTVSWDHDSLIHEDFWEKQSIYHHIHLSVDDFHRAFAMVGAELPVATGSPARSGAGARYRTDLAGRPSSKYLVLAELRRRAARGLLSNTLAAEARALRKWLQEDHPEAPPATQKTIENALRDDYWSLKRGKSG